MSRILGVICCLLSGVAVIAGAIAFCWMVAGCRQMPVLQGRYSEDRVEQARTDSRQSDRIADVCAIEEGMGTVLTVIAPEEVKPQAQAVASRIVAVKARADAEAAQGRDRSGAAERELTAVNAAPGLGALIGGITGAMGGNWSTLLDLALGALGIGGAVGGWRARAGARKTVSEVVDGVARYEQESPEQAEALKVHLSRSMDKRTKELVRSVKAEKKGAT